LNSQGNWNAGQVRSFVSQEVGKMTSDVKEFFCRDDQRRRVRARPIEGTNFQHTRIAARD
jgi:hypothetical protein